MKTAYNILMGKSEGKRPLWRPSRRWEDMNKTNLKKIGFEDVDWVKLTQDSLMAGTYKYDNKT
jgi:hypothetical protein